MENGDAQYSRSDLRLFHERNPEARFCNVDDSEFLLGLWEAADLRFDLRDLEPNPGAVLDQIRVDPRFDAIIHLDDNLVEFVYAHINPTDERDASVVDREFTLNFQGCDFECRFSEPTTRLLALARASRRLPSDQPDIVLPTLYQFRDAQRLEKLPPHIKRYFEGKVPRNFFVSLEHSPNVDLPQLARHINLLMSYYDRRSPFIVIRSASTAETARPKPIRFLEGSMPSRLTAREIDDILLTLLEAAKSNAPRAAFLYFYQVFEYAGHHYIDEKTRRSLKRLLRDPALVNCDDRKVGELFSVLSDLHHHDERRMQKVIEEHCDASHLWLDVSNDIDFFSNAITFDGGLTPRPSHQIFVI